MACLGRPNLLLMLALVIAGLVAPASSVSAAGRRVALVIGNGAYVNVGSLTNPANDAAAISATLRAIGFDDVKELHDLDQLTFRRALRDFASAAAGAETAVVYYAGHGVEVDGRNFLVPVDAALGQATDTEFEAIPLDSIRTAVSGATSLRLVILDACRNNPFKLASSDGTRSVGRGLARVEPGANEIVAYAAREGTLANDGKGANSPYAAALVKHLRTPGLDVRLMFGEVRDEVMAATGKTQEPFIYGTLGGQPIYLSAPAADPAPTPDSPPAPIDDRSKQAAEAWITVKDTTSLAILRAYIAKFEGTIFADLAAARLAELEAVTPAPVATPEPDPVTAPEPSEEEVVIGPEIDDSDNIGLAEPPHLTLEPQVFPVGKWAEGLAFDGKRLLVAESGQRTVASLGPDGRLLGRAKVGRLPVEVESLPDGRVFSLQHTDGTIWLHPPGQGKSRRAAATDKCPNGLAVTEKAYWVVTWPDCSSGDSIAVRIDAKSGKPQRSERLGAWGEAIAFGHGAGWVAHAQGGFVSRIDAASLAVERIPIGSASVWAINADGERIIVSGRTTADGSEGVVIAIDPASRAEVSRQTLSEMVRRLAMDRQHIVAIGLTGTIYVLSRETLALQQTVSVSIGTYSPSDALIIGEKLYIVAQQLNGENGAILVVEGWRPAAANVSAD